MPSHPTRTAPSRTVRAGLGLVLGALLLLGCGGDDGGDDATGGTAGSDGAATQGIDGVETERVGEYVHALGDLDYPVPAPSGGDHSPPPNWLTCGVYEGQVPDELAVHSLEHGAVWIALGPDSTPADREAATALAEGRKVFVSDVPDLPDPVELVAWGSRLRLDQVDDPRAERFIEAFVDADTAPEPGASCQSLGEPPNAPELPTS